MDFKQFLKDNIVILDGGMGTLLQSRGLVAGEKPERWNISHPDVIKDIHNAYLTSGASVISTNTFGANVLKFEESELEEIICAAVKNARDAQAAADLDRPTFVALDIGPTGRLLKPLGDLDFEDAVDIFAKTVRLGVKYGVDLIFIETVNDSYEAKAALLAAKENSSLPVLVSCAYGADGKLMTGASPEAMCALLEGMGADGIGANCSFGPDMLAPVIKRLLKVASTPVLLKANAGLPCVENGITVYGVSPEEFASINKSLINEGLRIAGGCCGTTPEHIKALSDSIEGTSPLPVTEKNITVVSSYTHEVTFGGSPILIGERINPTGKKRFKQALRDHDMDYILSEGVSQEEKGAHILDVNVGLPEINECEMLTDAVTELQTVTNLPLQIDTASPEAMERALRRYNGKAMINSVNGKKESMDAVFPLVKKYGGVVVALTLDDDGIPGDAEGRIKIAKKILSEAEKYGIKKKDVIFDTLAMTVSADGNAAKATIDALRTIKNEMGCHTSLGVSNVSFGLPSRDVINGVFFALALENGLSAAIMNPYSDEMMKTYHAFKALKGLDANCAEYIRASEGFGVTVREARAQSSTEISSNASSELKRAIIKGMKDRAGELTEKILGNTDPLSAVNNEIIPALNEVGAGFERGSVYLPQLLMSAEAAKSAFEVIKARMTACDTAVRGKGPIVIATVKGDIHDIGKNIVKLLLENYGYDVCDLGRDVPPITVLDKVIELNAPVVALSALMTTTVPAMEETVKLIKEKAPFCKTLVGGAVMNEEYAKMIGANGYAPDAMGAVRLVSEYIG